MKLRTLRPRLSELSARVPSARGTPRIRGRALQRIRREILSESPLCVMCSAEGRVTIATELDHRTPLAKGGTHARENLQPLCREHHLAKTAKEAREP